MVLVDTPVWIGHFRSTNEHLSTLLDVAQVLMHPCVIGELACGNLKEREMIIRYLRAMPSAISASDSEAMRVLESRRIWGAGIGWVDVHLVASALLTRCRFWTLDESLTKVSEVLGVQYRPIQANAGAEG